MNLPALVILLPSGPWSCVKEGFLLACPSCTFILPPPQLLTSADLWQAPSTLSGRKINSPCALIVEKQV